MSGAEVVGSAGEADVAPQVLAARAYLSRVAEPGSVALWALVERLGPVDAADAIRRDRVDPAVRAATVARRDRVDVQADLVAADRCGARLVTPESEDWPHFALGALAATAEARWSDYRAGRRALDEAGEPVPPLALWVRGPAPLETLAVHSAGIVGARAASAYGLHVTAELGYHLAAEGLPIVSGGAFGIDAAAHRAALAADGITVLVSAAGVERPYPRAHAELFEQVAATGLLVSESPPGSSAHRGRFLIRNRLIAALSTGVVVVEAGRRSGALNTAKHGFRIGRTVMAVPGPVTSALSVGTHALLRREPETAELVTCAADVLNLIGPLGAPAGGPVDAPAGAQAPGAAAGARVAVPAGGRTLEAAVAVAADGTAGSAGGGELRRALDALDPIARRVFDGLPWLRGADTDRIAFRSGVEPTLVRQALPVIELAGLAERCAEGFRVSTAVRRAQRPARSLSEADAGDAP